MLSQGRSGSWAAAATGSGTAPSTSPRQTEPIRGRTAAGTTSRDPGRSVAAAAGLIYFLLGIVALWAVRPRRWLTSGPSHQEAQGDVSSSEPAQASVAVALNAFDAVAILLFWRGRGGPVPDPWQRRVPVRLARLGCVPDRFLCGRTRSPGAVRERRVAGRSCQLPLLRHRAHSAAPVAYPPLGDYGLLSLAPRVPQSSSSSWASTCWAACSSADRFWALLLSLLGSGTT